MIQTSEVRNYFYPDLSVYCGPADFKGDALANPVLIVEVLSPSTQRRDLGYKLRHYKSIPSVQHVLFIQQDSLVALLHTRRAEDDWDVRIYVAAEQVIELTAIGISVTLGELYGPLLNQAPYNESPDPPERTR